MIMAISFWVTVVLVILWITLSALKFNIKNSTDENRAQVLHELGPSATNLEQPLFMGFFHPYW
jgi:alpha-1,2-mannosyltransferase